jgi:hypothetical protein
VSKKGWLGAALGLTLVIGSGPVARAYDQPVHVLLSARAYGGPATVPAGDPGAVRALRERVWHAGAESTDAELKRRFLLRYPTLESFDSWAFKQFLGLNPDKSIVGFDEVPLPVGDGRTAYAAASRLPDDDWRNRERFRHDANRKVIMGPYSQPLPDDPATLDMGGITGLSSQAHAHYQLPKLQFSDSPDVLKSDPRRFATPPTIKTFSAAYAEMYTVLAALASRLPGGERLALTHAAAAAHHVEDVANQIHTVQVGVFDFFLDAKLEQIKEELRSVGGLLRSRPSFVSIGIDIVSNHHTLLEALYRKHLLQPGDPVAKLSAEAPTDPQFAADLQKIDATCAPGFARAIVEALAERSSFEGPEVYAEIRKVANKRLSRVHQIYDDQKEDPDLEIRPGADLSRFYELQARGARRSDQALQAWWQRFAGCGRLDAAGETKLAESLVRARLDELDAADARAKAYVPKPPERESVNVWVPIGYALVLALVALVVQRVRRRRKR